MQLTAFRVEGLRNLQKIELELPPGLTMVAGENGQGKTSLLEAMYLLATGRSFRTRTLEELIGWENSALVVGGKVLSRRGEVSLAATIDSEQKALLVNGAKRGMESYLGRLDVVDLTAPRMNVLRGSPEERRRFIDRGIVGIDAHFLSSIGEYRRLLQQRNALLRRAKYGTLDEGQLDAWDERFISAAKKLHIERRRYCAMLAEKLATIGPELLPDGKVPELIYRPSPPELGEAEESRCVEVLAERLERCRGRDRELGHTSEGPHRDDLKIQLDKVDLRKFGSAGQVRAAMIALKLGKLSLIGEERGEAPLFLLDDFDTDLDDARMAAVATYLQRAGSQAVIATSKEDVFRRTEVAQLKLRMKQGVAQQA